MQEVVRSCVCMLCMDIVVNARNRNETNAFNAAEMENVRVWPRYMTDYDS